jgi:hypothetical protein
MAEAPSPLSHSSISSGDPVNVDASGSKIGASVTNGKALELDARSLARECLRLIGQEMGMGLGH